MTMHTIEIEDRIWQHLKKFAEPFEDTPNSVLVRLLTKHIHHRIRLVLLLIIVGDDPGHI